MNRHLKGFIASVVVIALCAFVTIATFAQGVWYGVFPLALGIFFLIKFAIPSWREYREETVVKKEENPLLHPLPPDDSQRIRINRKEPPTKAQQAALGKEILISYYMDLGEETAKDIEWSTIFENKRDIIELKIRSLIEEQERLHGTDFLTEDTDNNEEAKKVSVYVGKHCYAITVFYLLGFENSFPNTPFDKIIHSIVEVFDKEDEMKSLEEKISHDDILHNAYLEDMIKNKIEEQGI